jgi:predicted RNA-binding protein YlxR (DUF448 family)
MTQAPQTTHAPPPSGVGDRPQRTCVGCRRVDSQARLLRAVVDAAGRLQFELSPRRGSGRGSYVHRQAVCVQAAVRGGFARSLRRSIRANQDEIKAVLASFELTTQQAFPARAVCGHSNRDNS